MRNIQRPLRILPPSRAHSQFEVRMSGVRSHPPGLHSHPKHFVIELSASQFRFCRLVNNLFHSGAQNQATHGRPDGNVFELRVVRIRRRLRALREENAFRALRIVRPTIRPSRKFGRQAEAGLEPKCEACIPNREGV